MQYTPKRIKYKGLNLLTLLLLVLVHTLLLAPVAAETVQQSLLKVADQKTSGEYVRKRFVSLLKKEFESNKTGKKKMLVIGDSHAQDFINMVFENNQFKHYQIQTRHIPTRCQPLLGNNIQALIAKKDQAFCAKADSLAKAKAHIATADVIILVANWTMKSAKQLPNTLKNLQLNPQQKIFVVGRKSFGKVAIRSYLRQSEQSLRNLRNPVDAQQQAINDLMKSSLASQMFVDIQTLICDTSNTCRVFTSDLQLISFDGGHLTPAGARYLGQQLFQKSLLKNL